MPLYSPSLIRKLNIILLLAFTVFTVLIPGDYNNIKKYLFVILLAVNFTTVYRECYRKPIVFYYGIVFPTITILLSLFSSNATVFEVVARGYVGIYILLTLILGRYGIDYYRFVLLALKLLCIIVFVSVILDYFSVLSVYSNPLLMFLYDNGSAKIGKGVAYISLGYMIYLQAISLLLILLYDSYEKANVFWFVCTCISIFFSGSRAMWFGLVLEIVLLILFDKKQKSRVFRFLLIFFLVVFTITSITTVYQLISNSFELKAVGDTVRMGHMQSVTNQIFNTPFSFLFGSGYANYFYSTGLSRVVNVIELSYWDLLRQVGFICFICFMYFLIYPIIKLIKYKDNRGLIIIYILYLAIAYSNPLLYTSTPYVLYIILYQYVLYGKQLHFETNKSKDSCKKIRLTIGEYRLF